VMDEDHLAVVRFDKSEPLLFIERSDDSYLHTCCSPFLRRTLFLVQRHKLSCHCVGTRSLNNIPVMPAQLGPWILHSVSNRD
jgi:hypothetical protein